MRNGVGPVHTVKYNAVKLKLKKYKEGKHKIKKEKPVK